MRYLLIAAAAVALLVAVAGANDASAHGISPAKLSAAGWNCFDVPGLGVHCQSPGDDSSSATINFLYFDTTDPEATDAPFLGTELLIRAGLYRGQPCPQEGADEYTGLDLFGGPEIDYYACHHR